jgi:hypothetical protein
LDLLRNSHPALVTLLLTPGVSGGAGVFHFFAVGVIIKKIGVLDAPGFNEQEIRGVSDRAPGPTDRGERGGG